MLEEWLSHADELELLTLKLAHAGSIYLYGAGRISRELDHERTPRNTYLRYKSLIERLAAIAAFPNVIAIAALSLPFLVMGVKPFHSRRFWGHRGVK